MKHICVINIPEEEVAELRSPENAEVISERILDEVVGVSELSAEEVAVTTDEA